jgi:hypothetical protein
VNAGATSAGSSGLAWLVPCAGLVICYLWYRLIRNYRDLNSAKFKVIHELEKRMPSRPYDAEWEALGRGTKPGLYLPFSHLEMIVPWVFFVVHAFAFIATVA